MVTANVRFLTNSLEANLTCRSSELKESLEKIGVLTPFSQIRLDNARTLQINLIPNDEIGELICSIVNPRSDTLGNVQRLCRHLYCMNEQHTESFIKKLESGKIKTVLQGIKEAEKMRAEKNIER
ncbi:MAG: hypothetical protein E7393_03695 [Ruminococcaceae bacterium]|nr:hypothetical protein [Oscillospiraceae bacterium]